MHRESLQAHRVALITLGCAKNEADSRAIKNQLIQQGFTLSEDVETADVIMLNTCAFIEAAVEESLDTILELAQLERVKRGEARLLVAGCLPTRFGDELSQELPEVDAFIPVDKEVDIGETLLGMLAEAPTTPIEQHEGSVDEMQPWAYVKISDGCSRRCSYCTIPSIRGPYHSVPYNEIRAEVDALTRQGAKEIILIGQDTGIWSPPACVDEDVQSPKDLAQLLNALAQAYPETWFRIMYLQPEGVTDELLKVIAAHNNIASYLDIPFQHASARLLTAMNRRGSGSEYLSLLERIRRVLPEVTLRTTVIAGFPGETRKDFNELKEFIEAARFDYVGVFAYSREAGTVAAELPEQVNKKTALVRVQALRDVADSIGFELAEAQVGNEEDVLICGSDEEGPYGRTKRQAPDVDGITYMHPSEQRGGDTTERAEVGLGTMVRARITEALLYDLYAEAL